ncbi:Putative fatty acyl-CoA reductase CG5065 [Eumeta japonica]|uniref:Fatty acyl-CoA reductase CG5065 n=1 Tax=Eumeta variegata TaxID=151549 RepID=A0A4C1Z4N7_EUMVA|nr:Putative fatty acyl-CoA reductase CG5065 [Eumeta japonica]
MSANMSTEREGGDITYQQMVDDAQPLEDSEIQKFYAGATVLVTGGTGFLGKLLVEKLLRIFRKDVFHGPASNIINKNRTVHPSRTRFLIRTSILLAHNTLDTFRHCSHLRV